MNSTVMNGATTNRGQRDHGQHGHERCRHELHDHEQHDHERRGREQHDHERRKHTPWTARARLRPRPWHDHEQHDHGQRDCGLGPDLRVGDELGAEEEHEVRAVRGVLVLTTQGDGVQGLISHIQYKKAHLDVNIPWVGATSISLAHLHVRYDTPPWAVRASCSRHGGGIQTIYTRPLTPESSSLSKGKQLSVYQIV